MVLDLEFAGLALGTVVVQRVVDDDDVGAAAYAGRITSDGNTAGSRVVDYVVAHCRVSSVTWGGAGASGSSVVWARPLGAVALANFVFAGYLDPVVDAVDQVPLDGDVSASVAINTVGVVGLALTRIVNSADVIDRVPADFPVHGLVVTDGTDSLVSNRPCDQLSPASQGVNGFRNGPDDSNRLGEGISFAPRCTRAHLP